MKLPKPTIKLPKLKLPFGKGKGASKSLSDNDPDNSAIAANAEGYQPNDDYLRPTFIQKHGQWLAIGAAYFCTILIFGGIALYLMLNEEAIIAEMEAKRPKFEVAHAEGEAPAQDTQGAESHGNDTHSADNHGDDGHSGDDAEGQSADGHMTDGHATEEHGEGRKEGGVTAASARPEGSTVPADEQAPDQYAELLAPHPDPALVEESDVGPLPRIGSDGRTPWQVYSRPSSSLETRPRIAVVVTNLGTSTEATELALRLPGAVTLTFAPYSRKLGEWIDKARGDGHEVMITLPMEPRDFPRSDAGPYALLTTLTPEQNMRRLDWVLSRATGYIGVTNYQGSGFAAKKSAVTPIMQALAKRGLIYFDTSETTDSDAGKAAGSAGAMWAEADIVADADLSRPAITRKLSEAEVVAKSNKTAIVLIDAYPVGIDRVTKWIEEFQEKGLVLTPLSGVLVARAKESG